MVFGTFRHRELTLEREPQSYEDNTGFDKNDVMNKTHFG